MSSDVSRETPAIPDRWGFAVPQLTAYEHILATKGLEWGLIGPRELPRLWDRHVLNSAVLEAMIPQGATVIDVGSGAGLPGIPLAIVRPDTRVTLLEPLLRRANFLTETVAELGLTDRVTVVRGRAEDKLVAPADVVTSRAVAPMERLIPWCMPLMAKGGRIVALKGSRAAEELDAAAAVLRKYRLTATVDQVGADVLSEPTTVVTLVTAHGKVDS